MKHGRPPGHMASFSAFEKRMQRDVRDLHDSLWHPGWKGDPARLRTALLDHAAKLDAHLRLRGKLKRRAVALSKRKEDGPALFDLLYNAYHLTAATERLRTGDLARAGEHTARAVESMSIGLCGAAGCFPLVEEWEAGRTTFETYAGKLADALEEKGIQAAGQYKRVLVAARTFAAEPQSGASKARRDLAARAAVRNALWCAATTAAMAKAAGSPPKVPEAEYAAILRAISSRV